MRRGIAAIAAMAVLASTAGIAQTVNYWPAPDVAGATTQRYNLPMGTPLMLTTRTQASTKSNKAGDRIYLDVAESVVFRGQVVIPAGSVAVAEVVQAERNGHFGKKGKLDIRLLHVDTAYGPVRLSGHAHDEGTSATAASAATIAFVSVLGFLIHGTSANIPFGTTVPAYLAEPLRFTMAPATAVAAAQPDAPRALPASFDPSVFAANPAQSASR